MVDMSQLKKTNRLGTPPGVNEASKNLIAPEVAPAEAVSAESSYKRIDGRSARKTHRTLPFATRVSAVFDQRLRVIAKRDGLLLVEVLEKALDAYEAKDESV